MEVLHSNMKKNIIKLLCIVVVIIALSTNVFAAIGLMTENDGRFFGFSLDPVKYESKYYDFMTIVYFLGGYDNYKKCDRAGEWKKYEGPSLYQFIKAYGITKSEFIELWKAQPTEDPYYHEESRLSEEDIEVLFSDDILLINRTFTKPSAFVSNDGHIVYTEQQVYEYLSSDELQQLKNNGMLEYLENNYYAHRE